MAACAQNDGHLRRAGRRAADTIARLLAVDASIHSEAELVRTMGNMVHARHEHGCFDTAGTAGTSNSVTTVVDCPHWHMTSTAQWIACVSHQLHTMSIDDDLVRLLDMPGAEIVEWCEHVAHLSPSMTHRLVRATTNLRTYVRRKMTASTDRWEYTDACLAWSSAAVGTDGTASSADRRSIGECGVDSGASDSGVGSTLSQASLPTTTPPASPGYLLMVAAAAGRSSTHRSTTKSAVLGTSTTIEQAASSSTSLSAANDKMPRSRSHESHLPHRLRPMGMEAAAATPETRLAPADKSRAKSFSAAQGTSLVHATTPHSPSMSSSLTAPRSPRTGGRMTHDIPHKWSVHKYRFTTKSCDICQQSLNFRAAEKCSSCHAKVHSDTACKGRVADTCGISKEMIKEMFISSNEQRSWTPAAVGRTAMMGDGDAFTFDGSAGTHSASSSTPSTPAGIVAAHRSSLSTRRTTDASCGSPSAIMPAVTLSPAPPPSHMSMSASPVVMVFAPDDLVDSASSEASTVRDATLRSTASVDDDPTTVEDDNGAALRRHSFGRTTIRSPTSNTWTDVTIRLEDIKFSRNDKEKIIGRGRFGQVWRGYWHQDVAVKFLSMSHVDDAHMLDAFKEEVSSFKNTRHDNIVLFLGYCLRPPQLAIVMHYCRGRSLHELVHVRQATAPTAHPDIRIDVNRATSYALQVTQGMSYLHGRNILHKDLRTKNVFVEPNQKVVITDFALFSMARLEHESRNGLRVPDHWLAYLAPELIRRVGDGGELPCTTVTDVYAFGTIWYELMTGEFPFANRMPASIIWQVGRGIKPPISHVITGKGVKDVLVKCWSFAADARPDFNKLYHTIEKIPKKHLRLQRSPSHPIGSALSRSAESVF